MNGRARLETGDDDPVARFAEAAERYCAWAEHAPPHPQDEVDTAIRLLLEVMVRAMELPLVETDDEDIVDRLTLEQWQVVYDRFATPPVRF